MKILENKWIKFSAKFLVSIFFVWWIVFRVNWSETWYYLEKISIWGIVLYVSAYFAGMLFSAYKWKFLAGYKGIKLPFITYFKAYFTGTFINNFMPSFIGGDSYKIYNIGKISGEYKKAASSVVMDRITGFWGGMFLAFIFSLCNLKIVLENKILLTISLVNLLLLLIVLAILLFFSNQKLKSPFKKINLFFNKVFGEINAYNNKEKTVWKAIGLSFLFNLIGIALANYIIFVSLGISIGLWNYLSVIFLISIVASIPVSINNIGIKEWAYITFFGFFGVSSGAVVSVAIVSRLIQMLLSFFALPMYLKDKRK